MQNLAEIRLWNKTLGALSYDPATQITTFEYTSSWINTGVEIAPLHMPLPESGRQRKFQFANLNPLTYKGLPPIFADTLPDDFGNAVINAWLAKNGRDVGSFTSLERLLYTGNRGMGALEFAPALNKPNKKTDKLELESLISMAQQILDQRANLEKSVTSDEMNDDAMSALFQVGTSAGGARAKALIAINQDRTELRSGQIDAPEGFEHYLLKFEEILCPIREDQTG